MRDPYKAEKRVAAIGCGGVSLTALGIGFAVAVVLSLLVSFAWWATTTSAAGGKVAAMSWKHVVHRETFTLDIASDWASDISGMPATMPVNGQGERAGEFNPTGCYQKYHHNDRYRCGYTGTGENRRPRYCDNYIYKSYCTYSTYRWKRVETKDKAGVNPSRHDTELPWPVLEPGELDRIVREEEYHIDWSYGTPPNVEHVTRDIATETRFLTWSVGEPAVVIEYNVGLVSDVKHTYEMGKP